MDGAISNGFLPATVKELESLQKIIFCERRRYYEKMRRGLSLVMASVMAASLAGCSGGEKRKHLQLQRRLRQQKQLLKPEQHRGLRIIRRKITLRFVSWQTNHDAGNQKVAEAYKKLHQNVTSTV